MYAALTTDCRAFVNITGGGHCYFANSNTNCNLGELICPSPGISRAAQHGAIDDFAGLWLDHFLKGDVDALPAVLDSIDLSSRVTGQYVCGLSTALGEADAPAWSLAPVPANDQLFVRGTAPDAVVRVLDITGREVMGRRSLQGREAMDVSALPVGTYHLVVEEGTTVGTRTFVVMR